jgi:hypothetical protein
MTAERTTETMKAAMLEALVKTLGVVQQAAIIVGINRQTHYNWLANDPEYKAAFEDIGEVALDFAESQLHKQIANGEVSSTIFYLKTKGKRRGYIEKMEHDNQGEIIIKVQYASDSPNYS